jgi:hypothetical protein
MASPTGIPEGFAPIAPEAPFPTAFASRAHAALREAMTRDSEVHDLHARGRGPAGPRPADGPRSPAQVFTAAWWAALSWAWLQGKVVESAGGGGAPAPTASQAEPASPLRGPAAGEALAATIRGLTGGGHERQLLAEGVREGWGAAIAFAEGERGGPDRFEDLGETLRIKGAYGEAAPMADTTWGAVGHGRTYGGGMDVGPDFGQGVPMDASNGPPPLPSQVGRLRPDAPSIVDFDNWLVDHAAEYTVCAPHLTCAARWGAEWDDAVDDDPDSF